MAKKQTRRSISVSRTTYERLKAFCETNNISMSQFVETRVGDFLGSGEGTTSIIPAQPRPTTPAPAPAKPAMPANPAKPETSGASGARPAQQVPMTSAAARFAVEPPPPVIKRRDVADEAAPKPAEKRPEQIFTF
ncbi:MAG: hypothetical protein JO257_27615 [Deltaproteobacteria bacterium]|nr:hypothetical protein [Deltaproteobacteria bacterium]